MWKPHPIFNTYECNSNGDMRSVSNHNPILGTTSCSGYRIMKPFNMGKRAHMSWARFVYECHHGLVPDDHQIDHINANKTDNRLANLQCLSKTEHTKKTYASNPDVGRKRGIKHQRTVSRKCTKSDEISLFQSVTLAADGTPNSIRSKISACLSNRRKSHAGYTWCYVDNGAMNGEVWCCLRDRNMKGIEVSNLGRVKNKRGRISFGHAKDSYMKVNINQKTVSVHTLVCTAFSGLKPTPTSSVDHINRIRTDNRSENLRWSSPIKQSANMSTNVMCMKYSKTDGAVLGSYVSIAEAARDNKLHYGSVYAACIGKSKSSGGYHWKLTAHTCTSQLCVG